MQNPKKALEAAHSTWQRQHEAYEELTAYIALWYSCMQDISQSYQQILNWQGIDADQGTKAAYIYQMNSMAHACGFDIKQAMAPCITSQKQLIIKDVLSQLDNNVVHVMEHKDMRFAKKVHANFNMKDDSVHEKSTDDMKKAADKFHYFAKSMKEYINKRLLLNFPEHAPEPDNLLYILRFIQPWRSVTRDPEYLHWQSKMHDTLRQVREAVETMLQQPADAEQDIFADLRLKLLSDIDLALGNRVQPTQYAHAEVGM